jgi:hypothetical protein
MASAFLVAPAACSAADLQTDRTASFLHVPLFPKALWPGCTGRVAPCSCSVRSAPENGPLCSQSRHEAL